MAVKRRSKSLRKRKPATRTRKRTAAQREPVRSATLRSTLDPTRTREISETDPASGPTQTGASTGDLDGLETDDGEDFETVAELADEGQDLEAEEVEAIERTPNADQGDLKLRKVPSRTAPRKFSDRNRI